MTAEMSKRRMALVILWPESHDITQSRELPSFFSIQLLWDVLL